MIAFPFMDMLSDIHDLMSMPVYSNLCKSRCPTVLYVVHQPNDTCSFCAIIKSILQKQSALHGAIRIEAKNWICHEQNLRDLLQLLSIGCILVVLAWVHRYML